MNQQTSIPGLLEHDLEDQALSQLNATHYKEAIGLYKKLLQTAENKAWRQQLAYCYVQRAIQFAKKGMYKEALVLWENHTQHIEPPYDANDQYILWLIQTHNQAKIQTGLSALSAVQLDKQYPALASVLGILMLTDHPEFELNLPQDSVFIAHYQIVQKALQAYQNNDNEKLAETLKLIPYRSAFRDFRTLLNATLLMSSSEHQAMSLIAKIPANSAYYQASRTLLSCTKKGVELVEKLVQLSKQQCSVIGEIKGFDKKQLDFIKQYSSQHNKLTDKVQFKLAIRFKLLLGIELAQHFCQSILASYPAGKKEYNKHFTGVGKFEELRIKALNYERDNNLYEAEFYWRQCFDLLDETYTDNNLKRALILRRMASKESDEEGRTMILEESLDYDPDDRQSYLHILQFYSQQPETAKEYKKWLENTLKQFPQDVEVLTQAVKTATRAKSYTQANQYANKILKIDPINTFAKQTLFANHLSHARRLISKKNYQLAEKEVSQAEKLNISKAFQQQILLMRALLCFANEDKQKGLQEISEVLAVLHKDPVNSHFHATMEALLNGLPVATLLRELPPVKEYLLSGQALTELVKQIEQYALDRHELVYLNKALEKIKAPLKKSLTEQKIPEDLLLSFCEVLDCIRHFELLRHCVKSIPQQWSKPIWKYYRVYANTNGDAASCSTFQIQHLQFVQAAARNEQDYQTSILIEKYLNRYYDAHPQDGMGFLDDLFGGLMGDDDDDEDVNEFYEPMEELFGHLDEDELFALNEKAEIIMKKQTPEKLIHGVMKKVSNNEVLLVAIMQNPDILSALVLLKAADELKMNIEVDIDDVIDAFEITDDGKSIPCPF